MRRVSAYIEVLASNITDSLKDHISGEKLAEEVEKELQKQLLAQMVGKVSEYNQAISYYSHDTVKAAFAKKEMLRHMDYVRELFDVQTKIAGILPGLVQDAEWEIRS